MNNKRTWIIILAASLLLVGTVSLVAILHKKESNKGGVSGSGGQVAVNPVESDDTTPGESDTTQPVLTGVINQSSDGVGSAYIKSATKARYGFYTDRLKANTKYRLEWSLDPTLYDESLGLTFCQVNSKDAVVYNVDYKPNCDFTALTVSAGWDSSELYNGWFNFTSGDAGAVFAIFFMESALVDDSELDKRCFAMEDAVVFQIYEIS